MACLVTTTAAHAAILHGRTTHPGSTALHVAGAVPVAPAAVTLAATRTTLMMPASSPPGPPISPGGGIQAARAQVASKAAAVRRERFMRPVLC
ncbi:hypothetical protein A0U91_11500 [Acetobacter persici]|uniref:Uncharacterized protein n=1 Tax=Acetobacter persici TaxID=1076596 RepID=A0A1U9LFZ7_9PROT|nr:hypothetical protein A0U91_11500 [Acetobacter persici]